MYIFDIILMHEKSTQLQRTSFAFSKDKKLWLLQWPLLISFQYFKYENRLAFSFRCNLISMYFFQSDLIYLEISYVIIQYLGTVTLVDICSDLICLQSQWFSTMFCESFQEMIRGSVHFEIMFSLKFSLWWSPLALKLESYCMQLCQKNCLKLVFQVFPEQILFRGVPNQASKVEFFAKIVYVFKSFDYFL